MNAITNIKKAFNLQKNQHQVANLAALGQRVIGSAD